MGDYLRTVDSVSLLPQISKWLLHLNLGYVHEVSAFIVVTHWLYRISLLLYPAWTILCIMKQIFLVVGKIHVWSFWFWKCCYSISVLFLKFRKRLSFTELWLLHSHIHVHVGYILTQWITDAMIKTQEDFFNKILTSHFICKGSKRVTQGLRVRGSWRPNRTEIFWPPLFWPSTLCLSRSPDAQPEALGSTLLGAGFLYCILSATSLVPKLHRDSRGPPQPGVAFPTTSRLSPSPTLLQLALELICLDFCLDSIAHSIFKIACLIVIKRK